MTTRFIKTSLWTLFILVPDLTTKWLVEKNFELWSVHPVIPRFFNLNHVRNRGAAFGFLNDEAIQWQVPLFISINVLAIGFIIYLLRTAKQPCFALTCGLGLILGGALGNLFDRVFRGFVVDFLDFHVQGFHWPSFNVADIGITVGAVLVIIAFYIDDRANASDID